MGPSLYRALCAGTLSLASAAACVPKPAPSSSAAPAASNDRADALGQHGGEQRAGTGYDADLTAYPYPYEVRFHQLEAQGQPLRMAYMDVAAAQPNGRTVLLLHGKNFSGAYWADSIRALSARGYRVIAPDQLGFGKSSKPAHFQFSFHALSSATRSLLDALSLTQVSVVGHSMGGMLATRFALLFPERVERLALVNPIGLEDWLRVVPYTPVDQAYARELSNSRDKIRSYMRESYFAGRWKPEYEPLLDITAGWTEGPDRERIAWLSALTADMILTQPVVSDFARLARPTLLIIGTRDKTALGKNLVAPEQAQALGNYEVLGKQTAQAIPGAQLTELAGVGHLPQVEAFPQYIASLLTFLEASGAKPQGVSS